MRTRDYYQLSRVSMYGGVYILLDIEDKPLYVGYASNFRIRFSTHYVYLKRDVNSILIYPTNQCGLLEYTLIQRIDPIHNRHRSWNEVTRGRYGENPIMLDEDSYWGFKFYKINDYPYLKGSLEDEQYFSELSRLELELKNNCRI